MSVALALKAGHLGQPDAPLFSAEHRNVHNFSGGPGALPQAVLDQLQEAVQCVPEVGLSILGISHRSAWFRAVVDESEQHIRDLLGLSADWHVLFLQGGSSLQFSMIPMNLGCTPQTPVDWVRSGYWSNKAAQEAGAVCEVRTAWDGAPEGFSRAPAWNEIQRTPGAAFLHMVSNETVEGVQLASMPPREDGVVVCDMSSDFLARPVNLDGLDLVYAHAQKNLGPAGVTIVLLRDRLLSRIPRGLPPMLDYRTHIEARSIYNTPPVMAIYTMLLVLRWLRDEVGGLDRMAAINAAKAAAVYAALDARTDLYATHTSEQSRSMMNVAFRLRDPSGEDAFKAALDEAGFAGLDGHRSLGGFRASLYNAVSLDATRHLANMIAGFSR